MRISSSIGVAAAFGTADLNLLNWLWNSSKSHSIRGAVMSNSIWERYKLAE